MCEYLINMRILGILSLSTNIIYYCHGKRLYFYLSLETECTGPYVYRANI